jgi:hypothetical protein
MNRSSHCGKLIALVVLVSLVFAALTPSAAFAEGDIPEAPPAEVPPAAEEPQEDVPAAAQLLVEAGAVIVQDGTPLPLASQGALDGLCDPDPWYYGACTGGKCTYVWTSDGKALNNALNDWGANKGYGFIYIEHSSNPYLLGHYHTIDATLDGYGTLKGLVVDPGSDTPSIEGSLTFTNFTAGFTIQGLKIYPGDTVNSVLEFVSNKGTIKIIDTELSDSYKNGLSISSHTGAVELNRVSVHNNKWYGVSIDNCGTGATCAATGSVKITNSAIYTNGGGVGGSDYTYGGLRIQSGSPIVINGLTVTTSKGDGAAILAKGALSIKNSAFTDSEALDLPVDDGVGLYVLPGTTGSITLDNVLLRENDGSGIWIETSGNVTIRKVQSMANGHMGIQIETETPGTLGAMTVSISDAQLLNNSNVNLYVGARGAVTLTNVVASGSKGKGGAFISNEGAAAPPVTITNSVFSNNVQDGLRVVSNGVITINSVTVMDNKAEGAVINNGSTSTITRAITFLSTYGPNVFASNTLNGLSIKTFGNLVMNNVQAYLNGRNGVYAGAVSGGGLGVGGTILWNGGGAWNNGTNITVVDYGVGAILNNTLASLTRSVTLRNVVFDYNRTKSDSNPSYEGGSGLVIFTNGPVSITNINANGNSFYGVSIRDASTVSILRTLPSGNNTFNNNGLVIQGGSGLNIAADTNVVLNRVEAKGNTGAGAMIQSDMGGSVTITGTATLPADFSQNKGYHQGMLESLHAGLEISAYGIKLTNIRANENYGAGVFLRSWGSSVSILGTLNEFSGNSSSAGSTSQEYGLWIDQAYGPVTLLNFKAEENYGGGIYIVNTAGTGSVTLNSTVAGFTSSVTNGQGEYGGYGLSIKSRGAVTLTKVDISDGNQIAPGAYINNSTALTSMPVKVSLSSFNKNYGYGLEVVSAGAITVSKVTANGNKEHGVYLYNNLPLLPGQVYMPITILNSTFNKNGDSGAEIYSNRTITISSITASGNFGNGVNLENVDDFASSVLVTGKNQVNGNQDGGLYIESSGVVTVSGVEAGGNESEDGIYIQTEKTVTLSNSLVYNTIDYSGIYIYTSDSDATANVTITNVVSYGNSSYGLDIIARAGKVKLLNSSFILNGNYGFSVDVKEAPIAPSMTSLYFSLSNVNYFGNNWGGVSYYIY